MSEYKCSTYIDVCLDKTVEAGAACVRYMVADVSRLLADDALLMASLENLSSARRDKTLAYKHSRGRALSAGAGILLDELLAAHGLCERDMSYIDGEHGKPAFADYPQLAFNLSHSGSKVAAAISQELQVGIDIQHDTHYRPEVVHRVFLPAQVQRLGLAKSEAERQHLFTQMWAEAEAYAKATGEGLKWPFEQPKPEAVFTPFEVDDYCGCLCTIIE